MEKPPTLVAFNQQEDPVSEQEQPEVVAPEVAAEPESIMPAGINAPEEDLDAALQVLDPYEEGESPMGEEAQEPEEPEEPEEEHSEETDQVTEELPEPEEQAEVEEKPVEEVADQDTLEKALSALKRDGLSSSVIDKMTNSEIIELGLKRAKVQGDADNAYRELSELKKTQEEAKESETESPALAEPTDQPVPANIQEAIKPFAEIFGDDAAEALSEYGKASVQPLMEVIQAQGRMLETVLMDSAKGQLQDRFPQLADGESYARVSDRMQSLAKTGEYSDITALMSDAARIEFSDESRQVATEISNKRAKHKASGQMSPATGSAPPEHSLSDDEREEMLLNALEDGMPMHEARSLYGSAKS